MAKPSASSKQTNIQPACPSHGYSFVAAATNYRRFGNYAVYIKHKAGPKLLRVKQESKRHIWYECPDREIVIVRGSQETGAFIPSGDSFDEMYDFNMFNDAVSKSLGLEYIMTNFAHTKDFYSKRYPNVVPADRRIQVLSDSGGLQLARGVKDVIHPLDLIDYYNNNVDAGMILDIPLALFNTKDSKVVRRAALLQKANTDIMVEASQGVELINITHGNNTEQRQMFREIVEDPRVPRIAIAALDSQGLLTAVNTIYNTVYGSKMRYKQYHALGIFRTEYIPLFVKIANSGENPPHITSDSTSHIQSAITRVMNFQFDVINSMKRVPIGHRVSVPNTNKLLPCQCPVCTTLKYADIIAFGRGRVTEGLFAMHNAFEMARYGRVLQEACQQGSRKDYRDLVSSQLGKRESLREVLMCFDFIDIATDSGLAKARKKYGTHLENWKFRGTPPIPPSLFGGGEETVQGEDKQKVLNALLTRMEKQLK